MIGERIRTLRKAMGISQVDLARELKITKQAVSNWENGNISPSTEVIRKLALFFGCSADYLLELESNHATMDVSGLSPTQAIHIRQIVNDLKENNC